VKDKLNYKIIGIIAVLVVGLGIPPAFAGGLIVGEAGDTVFNDLNNNGTQDAGEPGLEGAMVGIMCNSGFSDSQLTDANGNYLITGIPSDDCVIFLTVLPGFQFGACNGQIQHTFVPGESFLDADFCLTPEPDPIILVHVDVKPQSCPNPINTHSRGLLPVAILGNELDVSDIDPSTIRLEGVSPMRYDIEDVTTPHTPDTEILDPTDCTTDGPDGIDDLTLKFKMQEVVAAIGPVSKGDVISVELEGQLLDGTPFEGYDIIIIIK
jgi:hypothetical protein